MPLKQNKIYKTTISFYMHKLYNLDLFVSSIKAFLQLFTVELKSLHIIVYIFVSSFLIT